MILLPCGIAPLTKFYLTRNVGGAFLGDEVRKLAIHQSQNQNLSVRTALAKSRYMALKLLRDFKKYIL